MTTTIRVWLKRDDGHAIRCSEREAAELRDVLAILLNHRPVDGGHIAFEGVRVVAERVREQEG